ncbi:hypothetical protein [Streptomyces fagopyri]|uniref:hypothetical protein n=1 Tax=Streptomyces fagopyri TaxID=2662397 RepID=UPI003800868D
MSTTPQMSQQQGHQHHQQGPSTAPPQPFGHQSGQPFGQQSDQQAGQPLGQQFGLQPGMGRQGIDRSTAGQLPFEQQPQHTQLTQQPIGQQFSGQQFPGQFPGQQPLWQQPLGQQQTPQQMGQQQMAQQIPQHLWQQLQQMGQQQPFQHLLQQLGGHQQGQLPGQLPGQGQPLVPVGAVASQATLSGTAQHFWDVVTPLPGQPSVLYLFVDNAWRALVNPDRMTRDGVQRAFAHGQQVIGVYDGDTVRAVVVSR